MKRRQITRICMIALVLVMIVGTVTTFAVEPRWTHIKTYNTTVQGGSDYETSSFSAGNFTLNHSQTWSSSTPSSQRNIKIELLKKNGSGYSIVDSETVYGTVSGKLIAFSHGSGTYILRFSNLAASLSRTATISGSAME